MNYDELIKQLMGQQFNVSQAVDPNAYGSQASDQYTADFGGDLGQLRLTPQYTEDAINGRQITGYTVGLPGSHENNNNQVRGLTLDANGRVTGQTSWDYNPGTDWSQVLTAAAMIAPAAYGVYGALASGAVGGAGAAGGASGLTEAGLIGSGGSTVAGIGDAAAVAFEPGVNGAGSYVDPSTQVAFEPGVNGAGEVIDPNSQVAFEPGVNGATPDPTSSTVPPVVPGSSSSNTVVPGTPSTSTNTVTPIPGNSSNPFSQFMDVAGNVNWDSLWRGFGAAYSTYANQQTARQLLDHYDKVAGEPAQYYGGLLRNTYTNPGDYFNSPESQAALSTVHNQLQRKDAAGGVLANDTGRQDQLFRTAMSNLNTYRTGLANTYNNLTSTWAGLPVTGATQLQNSAFAPVFSYLGGNTSTSGATGNSSQTTATTNPTLATFNR